ncbi:MAG TPA: hypothetical protein VEC19_14010 [Usitatibacter sp.]|nr:hypothetical protein [Usitatibacter sp.]
MSAPAAVPWLERLLLAYARGFPAPRQAAGGERVVARYQRRHHAAHGAPRARRMGDAV